MGGTSHGTSQERSVHDPYDRTVGDDYGRTLDNLEGDIVIVASKGKSLKVAWVGDIHCPYQDEWALDLACSILEDYKPDIGINGGDAVDFYTVSRFDKNPERAKTNLQDEIDVFKLVQGRLNAASIEATWYLLEGNHEQRFTKYLWKNHELAGLRVLTLPNILGLDELGVKLVDEVQIGKAIFSHGSVIRKNSAYTARAELEKRAFAFSTFTGHSHRGGVHYRSSPDMIVQGVECFHLCDERQAEYVNGADWQAGMVLVDVINGRPYPELIPFHGQRSNMLARWRGKEYR